MYLPRASGGAHRSGEEEWSRKAFDFAADAAKQVLTLAASVLALSITFLTSFLKDHKTSGSDRGRLLTSWWFLIASVLFGLLALFQLPKEAAQKTPDVYSKGLRLWVGLELVTFLLGLFFLAFFAAKALNNPLAPSTP